MTDAIVTGGGFFGCSVALLLARGGRRVTLVERADDLLTRASAVNQARVHTGFHYPRSFVTALRSLGNYQRFMDDFRPAIRDDFTMLYAIAREGSKVSSQRFLSMFSAMGAPIARAHARHRNLFSSDRVEDVFACDEFAFDHTMLRAILRGRLDEAGVSVMTGTVVDRFVPSGTGVTLVLHAGPSLHAPLVVNATYGHINALLARSGQEGLPLKFEIAEIALCAPPEELARLGVTLMDGPFFSAMPYPSRGLHSLTHVRHTPRASWIGSSYDPLAVLDRCRRDSAGPLMRRDAARFLPCMEDARIVDSLMEVKAVPTRNEADDGRPIIFHRHRGIPGLVSVLGGKLDNIYDLETAMAPFVEGHGAPAAGDTVRA